MAERVITEEDLVHAYNLGPAECIAHLNSLGVPRDVAERIQDWHCETTLMDEYEYLMRRRSV